MSKQKLKPCDCKDEAMTSMLNEQGISHKTICWAKNGKINFKLKNKYYMIPKEKAKQLKEKFSVQEFNEIRGWFENEKESKEVAISVCDEVLASFDSFMDARKNFRHELEIDAERYWLSVKAEIEKL